MGRWDERTIYPNESTPPTTPQILDRIPLPNRGAEIARRGRNDECFYVKYVRGMNSEAAEKLSNRRAEDRRSRAEAKRDRLALWIGAGALVASVLLESAQLVYQMIDFYGRNGG